ARSRGHRSPAALEEMLSGIVDRLCRRLRSAGRLTRTVVLRLRFDDFTRATRSHTLPKLTDDTAAVHAAAHRLLRDVMPTVQQRGRTLIGLALTHLDDEVAQSESPFGERGDLTRDRLLVAPRD